MRNIIDHYTKNGTMKTNYPAITMYVSSMNMSCYYFLQWLCSIYQWNAGHDDTVSVNHSINL